MSLNLNETIRVNIIVKIDLEMEVLTSRVANPKNRLLEIIKVAVKDFMLLILKRV